MSLWRARYQPRPKAVGWMPESRGPYLDDLSLGARRRHGKAVLLQTVDVKLDSLADEPEHILASLPHPLHSPASQGHGHPSSSRPAQQPPCTASLPSSFLLLEASLPEYGIQRTRRHVRTPLARNGNGSRLARVFVLPVTAAGSSQRHPSSVRSRISSPTFTRCPAPFSLPRNARGHRPERATRAPIRWTATLDDAPFTEWPSRPIGRGPPNMGTLRTSVPPDSRRLLRVGIR